MGNKYAFHALLKGIKAPPKAHTFYASSSTQAHKLRREVIGTNNVLYVSNIGKAANLGLPAFTFIKIGKVVKS